MAQAVRSHDELIEPTKPRRLEDQVSILWDTVFKMLTRRVWSLDFKLNCIIALSAVAVSILVAGLSIIIATLF